MVISPRGQKKIGQITKQIKKEDILFPVTLDNGYLSESDKMKINTFKIQ